LGAAGRAALQSAIRSPHARTRRQAAWALVAAFEGEVAFALQELDQLAASTDPRDRQCAAEAMIAGLKYPTGFARTPPGVDDRALRSRVRVLLAGWTANGVRDHEHVIMLDALNRSP
jgi:hypothetical protein